jgi:hypothetical protein
VLSFSKLNDSRVVIMKNLLLLSLLVLVSCSSLQPTTRVVEATSTVEPSSAPTFTAIPATATTQPTATPIPCNPLKVDFCIVDGPFLFERPIQQPQLAAVDPTYRYGSTADGVRDPHHGVEMNAEYGTPVLSAADGVILFAGPDDTPMFSPRQNFYGNMIVIQHSGGVYTVYAHLSEIEVKQGDKVTAGEEIGEVGQSGAATGSHLHFEVRTGNVQDYFSTQNPELWMIQKSDCGAMLIAVIDGDKKFQWAKMIVEQYSDTNELLSTQYIDTYAPKMATGVENAGLGDLPAGRYRVALIYNYHIYERWVNVQSGKLTQVVVVVK